MAVNRKFKEDGLNWEISPDIALKSNGVSFLGESSKTELSGCSLNSNTRTKTEESIKTHSQDTAPITSYQHKGTDKAQDGSGKTALSVGMNIDSPHGNYTTSTQPIRHSEVDRLSLYGDYTLQQTKISNVNYHTEEIIGLRAMNKKLKSDLKMSEDIRTKIQAKLNSIQEKGGKGNLLEKLLDMKRVQWFGI